MANPTGSSTSHGRSGKGSASAVPEHETWGGGKREEVAGGPAGRGNDGAAVADDSHTWSRGENHPDDPGKRVPTRPGTMGKGAEEPTGG